MDKKSDKRKEGKDSAGLDRALRLKFYNLILQQPVRATEQEAPTQLPPIPYIPPSLDMSVDKGSLLPTTSQGFTTAAYWNAFFEKKTDGFEWYGEYNDLATLLHKYMSEKDNILIVGCGNSDLSSSLHWAGLRKQTSIDNSPVVISQMTKTYPYLNYTLEDVTNLTYPDENFSCVLDKGTFDALSPPPTSEQKERIKEITTPDELKPLEEETRAVKMLKEVKRVLKPHGRFICISLLQPHLARTLFSFFHGEGWMIRVCRCHHAEEQNAKGSDGNTFPVYMCVFTKMNLAGAAPIEFAGSGDVNAKSSRLGSVAELMDKVKQVLSEAFMKKAIKQIGFCAEVGVSLSLFSPSGQLKYTTHTVDIPKFIKNPPEKQFGIFIVPQGRESEYMFGTHEGRTQLAIQSGFTRLVVIHLIRGQEYGTMNEVQAEIAQNVAFVTPATAEGIKSPIMTTSNELGARQIVFMGKSEFSGAFVVEDVVCEQILFRRLIFLDTPNVIQSEVTLGKGKARGGGKGKPVEYKPIPLSTKMTCEHHEVMAYVFGMLRYFFKTEDSAVQTLLLGLGGGLLVSFLKKFIPTTTVTAVEIDAEIVKVGRDYFGLPQDGEDKKFNIVVDDALNFLKNNESEYHVILVDVDSKCVSEGLSCPPAAFLEPAALQSMKDRLHPDGIVALNIVCRNPTLRKELTGTVCAQFPFVYEYQLAEDLNTILFCFNRLPPGSSKTYLPTLVRSLNYVADIQKPEKKKVPLKMNSKKVKNGGGDSLSSDEIAQLGTEASIEIKSRKFKILRKQ